MSDKETYKSPETANPQQAGSYKDSQKFDNSSNITTLTNQSTSTSNEFTTTDSQYQRQELFSILLIALILLSVTVFIASKINLKKRS